MLVKMASNRPVTCIAIGDTVYKPDAAGIWTIDESDVDTCRSHGLVYEGETLVLQRKTAREAMSALQAENDQLKAKLAGKTGVAGTAATAARPA